MSFQKAAVTFAPALALLIAARGFAQTSDGRITGVILDSSGAAIAGARITARSIERGVERSVESGSEGTYLLYPLLPGGYSVTVQAPGFRTERIDRMLIEVAAVVRRDIRLQVGAVEETVVVSAEDEPLLTQSGSVESTIVRDQINSLPLNGRDFNQLVLLSAGAVENAYSGHDFGGVAANGNRAFSNDYLLDGTSNNNAFNARAAANVSVDVIREFKVTSGVAPAEYGQAGTQVIVVTRSGNNRFHGSAFEYHRDTTWQASDPFNPGAPAPFARNQFGGSLGGPIRRNRTFFFFNYEGNRQNESITRLATVPADDFWKGDFSSLLSRNIILRDPLTTGRPIIPGNRLDQYLGGSRLDPIALKFRPFWGSPNRPGLANNLVQNADSNNTNNQFTTRIDHSLPRNQNLMFRLTKTNSNSASPSILGNGSGTANIGSTYNIGLGWTAPLTPHTANELRVGYIHFRQSTQYNDGGLPTTESLGLRGFAPVTNERPPMPRVTFTGNDAFTPLNYGSTETFGLVASDLESKTASLSETITHVRGRHTIKAGVEYRRLVLPMLQQSNAGGALAFSGVTSATSSGYTFSDFLMGIPSGSTQVAAMSRIVLRQHDIGTYIQDDWRVTRRLTLTMGLRHELLMNPYEDRNRLAFFDPITGGMVVASDDGKLPTSEFQPLVVSKLSDGNGNWRFPLLSDKEAGFNPRRLIDQRYKNFGPRFGFVHSLGSGNNFLIRGGYGIFYTRYPFNYLTQTLGLNPPFAGTFAYTRAITNSVPSITIQNPFGGAGTASVSPSGLQRNFKLPDNQQWNLTVERYLGWGTVLSLGYVGNKGTHLFRSANANGPILDPATGLVVRRFSNTYGNVAINVRRTEGVSIYNAMQTEVRRRTRKGLLLQANWTWAKGIDNVNYAVNANALDTENLGKDRADSDYVRRHMVKLNASYELPFGRGRAMMSAAPRWLDAAIGGWRLSGIWTYTTGMRFTPIFTTTGGLANNRPDLVYGAQANLPRGERTPSRWFNVDAFAEVPAVDSVSGKPRFGNVGRNILIGPGMNIGDTSLAKSFPIFGEDRRLTFRLELFNAFNHPNYTLPEENISSANTAATINSTVKPMRQAQFAVRFDF